MGYQAIDQAVKTGETILLDGATGTELQRRGVRMEPTAWCGPAALGNAPVLEAIHRDYIDAGARVITANTFATTRMLLARVGLGDKFDEINRTTVRAALSARGTRDDVAVAGSLSHMIPRRDIHGETGRDEIAESFHELAGFLKDAGCDLILLEMMFAPERMELAFQAAIATGLPVWAGFSARRGPGGEVLSFAQDRDIRFDEIIGILDDYGVHGAGVMHSESEVTGDAITGIRNRFSGPLSAYPDSGHMRMPDWQFEDVIPVPDFVGYAKGWQDQGVQLIGGCCGLTIEHIAALRDNL